MPDETPPDLLSMFAPSNASEAEAMLRAIQGQQAQQAQQRANLNALLGQQQQQAGGLRSLGLVASLGANPLLQGLRQTAEQQGMGLENAAARTEGRLGAARAGALDPMRLIALQQAAQRLKLQEQAAGARAGTAEERAKAAKAAAETKATQADYKREDVLRKEFQALPAYKNYQVVATAYDTMKQAAVSGTPQDDLTLITTFMKSIDPSTGVKDQEFNNAQQSGGMFDKVRTAYAHLVNGERLTPAMRKAFLEAARRNVMAFKGQHDSALSNYKRLATSYGVDPERVAMPIGMDLGQDPAPAQREPLPPAPGGRVGPGDPRSVVSTVTGKDGKTYRTYADGHVTVEE